jgi:hypothetical protein
VLAAVRDGPGCSVKDSFGALELGGLGFDELFEANATIGMRPGAQRVAEGFAQAGGAQAAADAVEDLLRPEHDPRRSGSTASVAITGSPGNT